MLRDQKAVVNIHKKSLSRDSIDMQPPQNISTRTWLVGQVLAGLCSSKPMLQSESFKVAKQAIDIADETLRLLEFGYCNHNGTIGVRNVDIDDD